MSRSGSTLELRHVTKRYGGKAAVDDLTLEVPAGAVCILVGPSGSGKTTSLRMINRLVEPTTGEILIDGADARREDPAALRRRIGYVIQQVGLFPHRTVADNIATVPRLLGWKGERVAARVDELVELIGLDRSFLPRYPAQLSGGERQRVGVARALAAEPPLLLMDEPFGAVDPIVRERLQDEFLRIQRALGTTVVFVTHDIDEAIKLGDHVAVLRDGRLVQYAPPAVLLDSPADDFVARVVGADRGLKRLALVPVGELPLRQADTLADGAPLGGGEGFVLRLGPDRKPIGWVNRARPDLAPDPSSPILRRSTRARDALSLLLAAAVRDGVVVDDEGRYVGVIGIDEIASTFERAE
ncbi:MAG TPA: ABC transporter ATP-binding protein [Candidatus Limnocylindria bacterium]|nr:ABC transporter ATP-binding protein [Candidatus Limnocylindria bacterium]